MRRREFVSLLGGAAVAWPLAARAQRSTSVIGVLSGSSLVGLENRMANFRRGLAETGYVEGRNLTIEFAGRKNSTTVSRRLRRNWLIAG